MDEDAEGESVMGDDKKPLRRGVDGVCTRSTCECEREGLGEQCIWLRPTDAELERLTGEPHIDGWPLYSGLPPPADKIQRPRTCETCAHRSGAMLYGKCMLSGFFIETERKFPLACGKNFEGWIQRESLLQRFKAWLYLS